MDKLLDIYRENVLRANKTMNLISRQNVDYILDNLIRESLVPLNWDKCKIESPLIDVGSGAGIPGIPLKIVKPGISVILVESNRRKSLFLRRMIEILGLESIDVLNRRVEEICLDSDYIESFSTLVIRGVGKLKNLLNYGEQLLKPGGEFIAWKGSALDSEIQKLDLSAWSEPEKLVQSGGLILLRLVKE